MNTPPVKLKILYLITKSNFGGAERLQKALLRNPRFLTLPAVTVFLHGELPFPDPLPRPAVLAHMVGFELCTI